MACNGLECSAVSLIKCGGGRETSGYSVHSAESVWNLYDYLLKILKLTIDAVSSLRMH